MINPPIGLYTQLQPKYLNRYINDDKYHSYLKDYIDSGMWWGPPKGVQQEDKLLKNVDICLELIDEYERRISKI
jgi:hypothetical protein